MPKCERISISTTEHRLGRVLERKRSYTVYFSKDSEEREQAVRVFQQALFPAMDLPDFLWDMTEEVAQSYLEDNLIQESWRALYCHHDFKFKDEDLSLLQYIPELETIFFQPSEVSDGGIEYLKKLNKVKNFLLYSKLVTDDCLEYITHFNDLLYIDFQGSPNVSKEAFDSILHNFPKIINVFPPYKPPHSS